MTEAARVSPKGLWVLRRTRKIDPEAYESKDPAMRERQAKAFAQALEEFESGKGVE